MLLKSGGEGKSRIGAVMQKLLGGSLKTAAECSPFACTDLEHELLLVDAIPDEVIRAYTAQKYEHHSRMNQEI